MKMYELEILVEAHL